MKKILRGFFFSENDLVIFNFASVFIMRVQITLMASSPPELCLIILQHIELLLSRDPSMFASEFNSFFCRYNEPSYIKSKKLEIITIIATTANTASILEELGSYVTDVDAEMARKSIRSIGRIAVRITKYVEHIISMLLAFQELDISYVTAESLCVLRDILRILPDRAARILPSLTMFSDSAVLDG